jgi:alpha-glucoside transport system permease protein
VQWFLDASTTGHKFALMVVAILLFALVMGAILFAVDRPKRVPNWVVAAGFLGPTIVLLLVGLVYPALDTIRGSFFDRDGASFVGLDNYATVFTESNFQVILRNTVFWVVLVPLVTTGLGLLYAYLVDRTRFEALAKALVFLPMAISMVGAGVIWKFVYEYRPDQPGVKQIGLLNQLLVLVGIDPQQFLLNQPSNNLFLILVMIWIQTGFAMTVLSAAIKAIPDEITEAARLDGVSGAQMFRFVTVPSIRPALVVVLTTVAIVSLKAFDVVRTMTGGQFGTGVVANEFYIQSFRQFNFGLGAALAVLLFLLVIPIVAYNVRQLRLAEEIR